jgi:hypothetical protein
MATGKKDQALQFIKNIMTLEGIINSPNGQPAMYEYRNADKSDYGKIDKPQFMWAAGWYLYCLYNLYAVRENPWNIRIEPYVAETQEQFDTDIFLNGKNTRVTISGKGSSIKRIKYDGKFYPSAIIPENFAASEISVELGYPERPMLQSSNAIVKSIHFQRKTKTLELLLKAFPGHANTSIVIAPQKPVAIFVNGAKLTHGWKTDAIENGGYQLEISFAHQKSEEIVRIEF